VALTVRDADPGDIDAVGDLLVEMDRFYGGTPDDSPAGRREQIAEALFGSVPWAYALVAVDDGQVVGLATYSYHWPAVGLTRSIFLKELYVARHAWRRGIGQALMERLVALGSEHGCSRVEWMADVFNQGAQDFYQRLGFTSDGSKLVYRVEHLGSGA
jgi:GNAT superfamily N-acetyltransferase